MVKKGNKMTENEANFASDVNYYDDKRCSKMFDNFAVEKVIWYR